MGVKGRPASPATMAEEALGAPRDRRAAMKELDGAIDIGKNNVSALPKKGQGRELVSLDLHRICFIMHFSCDVTSLSHSSSRLRRLSHH